MSTSASKSAGYVEKIEQISKAAVLAVALLYAVGMIVTNSYLLKFGVSEFELLRSRFVLTGILTIAPMLINSIGFIAGYNARLRALQESFSSNKSRGFSQVVAPILISIFVPVAIYWGFFAIIGIDRHAAKRMAVVWLIGAIPVACIAVNLLAIAISTRSGEPDEVKLGDAILRTNSIELRMLMRRLTAFMTAHKMANRIYWALIFSAGYLLIAAHYLYPNSPEQFGGGRAQVVQLLFVEEATQVASQLHIELKDETSLSVPLKLIWQDSDGYLVRIDGNDDSVVLIDKDLVQAVVIDTDD